jgi:hypothetical protein
MLRVASYLMWIAPALVFAFMAAVMHRRGQHQRFPYFFSYAVFQVASFLVQFTVFHYWPNLYFYEYWVGAALSIAISFAVIYEVFAEIFDPFEGLRDLGKVLFRWAAIVLVLAAVVMIVVTNSATASIAITRGIVAFERSVRIMQCGMVLLMILCAPHLGLRRGHRVFGIGVGFGVLAAIDLIAVAVVSRIGLSQNVGTFNSVLHMAAFNFAAVLWLTYFLRPEPARGPVVQVAPSERWNYALSTAMHPQTSGPSLPLIMGVVDRAFQRISHEGRGPLHADQ